MSRHETEGHLAEWAALIGTDLPDREDGDRVHPTDNGPFVHPSAGS